MAELFSAFGVEWHLLVAQAVNFAIVLGALWYFLYRPVLSVIEKRRALVAKGVEDAQRASEMLASADGEAQTRVSTAEREAERLVSAAREVATAEKVRLLKDAEERAAAIAKDALARSEEVAAKAKRESEREVARLAVLAAEKVLRQHHD